MKTHTFKQKRTYLKHQTGNPDCSKVTSHQSQIRSILRPQSIQTKLTIGSPNDQYEQEADRVADQIVRMPEPMLQKQPLEEEEEELQTKPIADQITPMVQRQIEEEEEEELIQPDRLPIIQRQEEEEEEIVQTLQRQCDEEECPIQTQQETSHTSEVTPNLASQIQAIRSGGRSLPQPCRNYFEPRFGRDFSDVHIHTDSKADDVAKSINAKAFTLGQDVFFGSGQFAPGTEGTKKLLAHELTHVVQQGDASMVHKFKSLVNSISSSQNVIYRSSNQGDIVINSITFDGKQVSLSGTKSYSAKAVSGLLPNHSKAKNTDYTQPQYQNLPDKGPIREGKYYIKPSDVQCNKKSNRIKCSKIVKFNTTAWGNYRTGLDESFFTKVGRHLLTKRTGGFWLHQDANHNGTAGCIGIWNTNDNEEIHHLISHSKTDDISVHVNYPKYKAKASGSTIINYPNVHLVRIPKEWRTTRIARISKGTEVVIITESDTWTKIRVLTGPYIGESGWVMNQFLTTAQY
ncbi:hypothetical protein CEE37_12305 [candidate division LCP-89 bacterium B3_LCP]|uniref:eCIS core domain-containing protein n=1 Tax=candidate division LCP-89 bacterium B3_LCP TaxID=2012998 RepID=A0A532UUE6_UNCL8|nr:MAG: hypothetical protein CEE37_12305 [candidate division LCP-89 bacterium B3_LCP]